MGLTGPLPDNILRRMDKKDRGPLGKAGVTNAEADAKGGLKLEREMHSTFAEWLTLQGIPFNHDDPTRKRHGTTGWPDFDFAIYAKPWGIPCAVEFKRPGERFSPEQALICVRMIASGWRYEVVFSAQEAIDWVLKLKSENTR